MKKKAIKGLIREALDSHHRDLREDLDEIKALHMILIKQLQELRMMVGGEATGGEPAPVDPSDTKV